MSNLSALFVTQKDTDNNSTVPTPECLTTETTNGKIFKAFAYTLIILIALIGNLFVILVVSKNKPLRKTINYFILNMAVSDLLPPLTIMPIRLVEIISGSFAWRITTPPFLGLILCKLAYFLADVSVVVSIESLLLMSADRLIAVVFPLKMKLISSKVRLKVILGAWVVAIAVHAPYFYTFKLFPEGNETYCESYWGPAFDHVTTHKRFYTATYVIFFILPLCMLAIIYSVIAITLNKKKDIGNDASRHQARREKRSKHVALMSLSVVLGFAFCTIPNIAYIFVRIFVWNWEVPPMCAFRTIVPFIGTFMLHSWSAVHPGICFVFITSYRSSLRELLSVRSPRHSLQGGRRTGSTQPCQPNSRSNSS